MCATRIQVSLFPNDSKPSIIPSSPRTWALGIGYSCISLFFLPHLETLDVDLKANSDAGKFPVYCGSKFVQLLGAHYWRRHLPGCTIVAVSPGLVPDTNLATGMALSMSMADAKTVPEGM